MSTTADYLRNVAIVGAGGQIGAYLTQALLATGKHTVTAITREGSTSSIPSGCQTVKVNYDDHASLVAGLKNQDLLIITMAVTAAPDTQVKLIAAAAEAGVKWIMPNEYGYDGSDEQVGRDTIVGASKKKVQQEIVAKGMNWLGIANGFWYEFSLSGGIDRYGVDIKNREILWFEGKGADAKLSTTTFLQVGRGVASLLSLPVEAKDGKPHLSQWKNTYAHIASFTISQREMVESLYRVTGTTEADWKQGTQVAKDGWETAGVAMRNGDRMAFSRVLYWRYFCDDAPGDMVKTYGLDNKVLGLPEEDVDEATKLAVGMAEGDYMAKQYEAFHKAGGHKH